MILVTMPDGEIMEIHDDMIERAFEIIGAERDDLILVLYDLLKERNPETCARARAILKHHGRR
jgi:hypothetical protein